MEYTRTSSDKSAVSGFLQRLARDKEGNTAVLIAASIAPLLALIGGGIDMSRSYLSQARLQQACDAGVLAARKKLGSAIVTDGVVPSEVADVGNRFFNINFRTGAYGSEDRQFTMAIEDDYAISATASVEVPTTIMAIFGNEKVGVNVDCEANINFGDTDIMFVLDTTGSMRHTNPGDSETRIDALRRVVKDFHGQLEGSKPAATRIRYGFVPYAINANVGHLLEDDWVVDEWTYQSREKKVLGENIYTQTDWANWTYVSGSFNDTLHNSYPATWVPGTPPSGSGDSYNPGSGGYYTCALPNPLNTHSANDTLLSETSEPYPGPPSGTKTTKRYRRVNEGSSFWTNRSGTTCNVTRRDHNTYVQEYDRITYPASEEETTWLYKPIVKDVSNWRAETNGCMEERDTYEIYTKFETVDLTRALDLDIDRVPSAGDPATQWRPMYPDIVWARALHNENANSWRIPEKEYSGDYYKPAWKSDQLYVACPSRASKLAEMDASAVATYVDALETKGKTYHDIGMIWGGRLLSGTGLFADENADRPGRSTSRHMVFLTDGQTEPSDNVYGAYGLEQLELRRWTLRPDPLLDRTIELRFYHACNEVKKKNITVWVIGFGTTMNDVMKECAGDGHWFQADDADQLEEAFDFIAKSMGDLRITD